LHLSTQTQTGLSRHQRQRAEGKKKKKNDIKNTQTTTKKYPKADPINH